MRATVIGLNATIHLRLTTQAVLLAEQVMGEHEVVDIAADVQHVGGADNRLAMPFWVVAFSSLSAISI